MLDSSIAMGVKPVQFENPMNSLAQILQIKGAQNQNRLADLTFQQHQQALDESNKLNALYAGAMSPEGQIDRAKLYQGAASSNLGSKIPGLQKGFADMDAGQVKVDAEKFKLASDRVKGYKSDLGALYQDPALTKEKAIARMQARLQQGLISQEMYQHIVSDLPDDPNALREQLGQGIKEQLSPEQALTLFAPKTEYKDNGQKLIPVQTNPLAQGYVAPTEIQKLATPEALLTDSRTRSEGALNRGQSDRHFNTTQAAANQAVTYQTDSNGNLVALPTKVNANTGVTPIAVTGADGKPMQGKNTMPVEFNKSVTGLKELTNALGSYEQTLKDNGGASPLAVGARRGNLQGSYTALQMGLKNAFELGALAGPDLSLLQGMLVDPTSVRGLALGDKGIAAQIDKVKDYIKNRGAAVYEAHKQPIPPEFSRAGGSKGGFKYLGTE